MGIRFACHVCHKPLNIKNELAGKRGVCPQCQVRFRIPTSDTSFSIPLDDFGREQTDELPSDEEESIASPPVRSDSMNLAGSSAVGAIAMPIGSGVPSLLDDASATWYVRPPSGGQYGPATGEMLRSWINEARVTATSLVWRDGWAQWRSAGDALMEFGGPKVSGHGDSGLPAVGVDPVKLAAQQVTTQKPTVALSGDPTIGVRKNKITQRRFVIVGTLATISMTLIGILIFLLQRNG